MCTPFAKARDLKNKFTGDCNVQLLQRGCSLDPWCISLLLGSRSPADRLPGLWGASELSTFPSLGCGRVSCGRGMLRAFPCWRQGCLASSLGDIFPRDIMQRKRTYPGERGFGHPNRSPCWLIDQKTLGEEIIKKKALPSICASKGEGALSHRKSQVALLEVGWWEPGTIPAHCASSQWVGSITLRAPSGWDPEQPSFSEFWNSHPTAQIICPLSHRKPTNVVRQPL